MSPKWTKQGEDHLVLTIKYTSMYTIEEMQHMTPAAAAAFNELLDLGAPIAIWHQTSPKYQDYRGFFWISGEETNSYEWADYYENFWGSEKLNNVLEKHGLYFQWQNAAVGCVYSSG